MSELVKRIVTSFTSSLARFRPSFASKLPSETNKLKLQQVNALQKSNELYEVGMKSLKDVERNLEITDLGDTRLNSKIEKSRTSFTLALAYDPENLDAALALSKIHLKFDGPACSPISGVSLLFQAAEKGSAEAAYDIFCRLRADEYLPGIDLDDETAMKYLKKAAEKGHADALFSMAVHFLTQENKETMEKKMEAKLCLERAANQGHSAAAMVLGAVLIKEINGELFQKNSMIHGKTHASNLVTKSNAKSFLDLAAQNGEDLAFEWLQVEKIKEEKYS